MVRILNPVGEFKREQEHSKVGKMDFKIGDISCYSKVIVADENREVKAGKPISIKIKEIEIPANYMAIIGAYASNKYGHPIAVGGHTHLPLSMDKKVNRAAFTVVLNGKIEEGDLLGFLSLIPIEF
ncbi:MAG: DUF22 domain-containing protein [Methanobacteriaceae archaeon]